jgi:hypothetical protein
MLLVMALHGCGNAAEPGKPDTSMPTPAPAQISPPATPAPLWLAVGASAVSALEIAKYADRPGLVFSVRDCGEERDVLAWAWSRSVDEAAIKTAVAAPDRPAKDGYAKRCNVKPGSLLALGIPALDPSIAKVPQDAVNWSDADRVSVIAKPDKPAGTRPPGALLVVKYFDGGDPNDELEGRRERIEFVGNGKRAVLEANCPDAAAATAIGARVVAFTCTRGQMADQLLHVTFVHDRTGKRLATVENCRTPRFGANEALTCQAESVADDGALKLAPRAIPLQ